ncbi:MAG: AAA family ATPase [Bacteroidota bacterium]
MSHTLIGDVGEKVAADGKPIELGISRWACRGDTFYGVGETRPELPTGLYRCDDVPTIGPCLVKQRVETDKLLELPDDAGASLLAEFAAFWQLGEQYRGRGFLHKRGFLLWGPPGSGKTSTLQIMIKRLIEEMRGIVLLLDNPHLAAVCLQMARKIEPTRPMLAIMEDMDALVRKHGENEYLALLDGEAQVDRIVFLGTTNYPELLDKRFVDRPSRFDTIRHIGMPSAAARRMYLRTKEPSLKGDELEAWVRASDGFSIAHLKEMIIAVKLFGQPLDAVIERLEAMRFQPSSAQAPDRGFTGFLNGGRA